MLCGVIWPFGSIIKGEEAEEEGLNTKISLLLL
jgi:hypothetical protein